MLGDTTVWCMLTTTWQNYIQLSYCSYNRVCVYGYIMSAKYDILHEMVTVYMSSGAHWKVNQFSVIHITIFQRNTVSSLHNIHTK